MSFLAPDVYQLGVKLHDLSHSFSRDVLVDAVLQPVEAFTHRKECKAKDVITRRREMQAVGVAGYYIRSDSRIHLSSLC